MPASLPENGAAYGVGRMEEHRVVLAVSSVGWRSAEALRASTRCVCMDMHAHMFVKARGGAQVWTYSSVGPKECWP